MSTTSPAVNLIGLLAAACTTISFVPQIVRVWRLRSAREISFTMFSVFSLGVVFWLIYGICIRSVPVILANTTTLVLSLGILVLKIRFERQQKGHPASRNA
jgi:MtN3 and saliva related transmembrane protein